MFMEYLRLGEEAYWKSDANESITETIQIPVKELSDQLGAIHQSIFAGYEATNEKIRLQTKALIPIKWISSLSLLAIVALIFLAVKILTKT